MFPPYLLYRKGKLRERLMDGLRISVLFYLFFFFHTRDELEPLPFNMRIKSLPSSIIYQCCHTEVVLSMGGFLYFSPNSHPLE